MFPQSNVAPYSQFSQPDPGNVAFKGDGTTHSSVAPAISLELLIQRPAVPSAARAVITGSCAIAFLLLGIFPTLSARRVAEKYVE